MLLTVKQSILTIKYITWFISLLLSLNSFAVGDLVTCTKDDTAKSYNNLYDQIEETQDIIKNIHLIYDLARTAFCIDKNTDGMMLLQRAADKKHIPAIYLLGIYHRYNQTFYSSEYSDNLENIDKAIYYYTKAARMIEDLPDYPKGATSDIARIEHTEHMSYHLFTGVPFLYFRGYFITFNVIMNDRILYDSIYTDTLEILYKMKNSAKQCLDRSALNVWQEERSMLHAFQQLKCNVFLKFAEKAYPLEKQRIEVAKSCQGPVNRCYEHQEVVNKINELAKEMFQQIMSVPKVEKLIRFKKK